MLCYLSSLDILGGNLPMGNEYRNPCEALARVDMRLGGERKGGSVLSLLSALIN